MNLEIFLNYNAISNPSLVDNFPFLSDLSLRANREMLPKGIFLVSQWLRRRSFKGSAWDAGVLVRGYQLETGRSRRSCWMICSLHLPRYCMGERWLRQAGETRPTSSAWREDPQGGVRRASGHREGTYAGDETFIYHSGPFHTREFTLEKPYVCGRRIQQQLVPLQHSILCGRLRPFLHTQRLITHWLPEEIADANTDGEASPTH